MSTEGVQVWYVSGRLQMCGVCQVGLHAELVPPWLPVSLRVCLMKTDRMQRLVKANWSPCASGRVGSRLLRAASLTKWEEAASVGS